MREAIGQLMTSCFMDENTIPAVAVPYTKKSLELAKRWSKLEQIRKVDIRFILVQETGYDTINAVNHLFAFETLAVGNSPTVFL